MEERQVGSEEELIRLAVDLGAEMVGGPLTAAERRLVARAESRDQHPPELLGRVRDEIRNGRDPLGEAFCRLRPPLARRHIGAFYTPFQIVEAMVDWVLGHQPSRIVDPGCGSGRYAVSAARRDPTLEIVAIDLDPVATLMTRAALAVIGATNASVLCADFLSVRLPETTGRTAWVGNPPYVRHHDLSSSTKAWAAAAAKQTGHPVSGLTGLHALFFLAAALKARKGDVGSFITSSEWLDVRYGDIVRHLLTNGLGGRALDLIDPRAVPFAEAMTTALITCFEVGSDGEGLFLRQVSDPSQLSALGRGRTVLTRRLASESRWSPLFRDTPDLPPRKAPRRIGELARVHRGFVTGANHYFIFTRERAEELGLTRWCRPAITSASEILESDGVVRDGPERRLVLDLPADLDRAANPALDAYLRQGEALGIADGYIASHRRPWWRIGIGAAAPIVASYMARQPPRFALNPDGLALVNIGHGLYPTEPMGQDELQALATALNAGRESYPGTGRTYHGGLEKFEPREMEALPVDFAGSSA